MESIVMHRILNIIYNNNIDIVEEVFKNKVGTAMLNHLLNRKEYCKREFNDNTKAWMHFIGALDSDNSAIIFSFINDKKK